MPFLPPLYLHVNLYSHLHPHVSFTSQFYFQSICIITIPFYPCSHSIYSYMLYPHFNIHSDIL